jgi:tRNA threonylcarbamoyl adenosine modification protein YjeE
VKKILINSKVEMAEFAAKIAAAAKAGDSIGLKGTLGVGKSFFAKSFINSLQEKPSEVLSPTFNLLYSYDTKKGEVSHFDLYRLKTPEELENIGFFDALKNGISLIEWPEIAADFLKKNYTEIEIKIPADIPAWGSEETREIIIKENGKI